jgi:hypothetical protein
MDIDLRSVPDEELLREYRRRAEIERNFVWAVSLMRDYAVWESESGRARKVTEWHARQIAERLCAVLGVSREEFSRRVIEAEKVGKPSQ